MVSFQEKLMIVIGISFVLTILLSHYLYYNPDDDWDYCKRNMPAWNNTGTRSDICFTEQWEFYCKLRAPAMCPDYNHLNNFFVTYS